MSAALHPLASPCLDRSSQKFSIAAHLLACASSLVFLRFRSRGNTYSVPRQSDCIQFTRTFSSASFRFSFSGEQCSLLSIPFVSFSLLPFAALPCSECHLSLCTGVSISSFSRCFSANLTILHLFLSLLFLLLFFFFFSDCSPVHASYIFQACPLPLFGSFFCLSIDQFSVAYHINRPAAFVLHCTLFVRFLPCIDWCFLIAILFCFFFAAAQ